MVRSLSAFLIVIPAQAGIQVFCSLPGWAKMDTGLRRYDRWTLVGSVNTA